MRLLENTRAIFLRALMSHLAQTVVGVPTELLSQEQTSGYTEYSLQQLAGHRQRFLLKPLKLHS